MICKILSFADLIFLFRLQKMNDDRTITDERRKRKQYIKVAGKFYIPGGPKNNREKIKKENFIKKHTCSHWRRW